MNALVFDLGTSYFKAGVYDRSLSPLASASRPAPVERGPGRSQIDPGRFIETIRLLAADLRRQSLDAWAAIDRISFASQANSALLLDHRDQPLTPIILWDDRRALAVEDLHSRLTQAHPPGTYAHTGIISLSEQYLPARLLWLARYAPEAWSRCRRICLISDYLTGWLSGRFTSEASLAGLTGLLDIHTLAWRSSALEDLGISLERLNAVVRAGTVIGNLTRTSAQLLELPLNCRIIAGCLDQFAGALGAAGPAAIEPGTVTQTTGTVLSTVACADHFDPALASRGIIQGPAAQPGRFFRLCFGEISGALLEAYRQSLPDHPALEALDQAAAEAADHPNPVAVDVEHWLTQRQLRFSGETAPSRGQAVLAIQQAVARALAAQVQTICPDATRVFAAGGAARSRHWLALKSAALGIPLIPADTPEPTSRGAAALAFLRA